MTKQAGTTEQQYPGHSLEEIQYQKDFGAVPCPKCSDVFYPGLNETHSC